MVALCLSNGANDTLAKASGNTTLAKASGNTTIAEASGNDHGVLLSSEQHYKNSNNSLRILAVFFFVALTA
jgi:hypothetical protein